jgi:8-oxo-dGTP pyrophosphatase MutT (NUDIX family)
MTFARTLWVTLGHILYVVCWPLIFLYAQIGSRTRVIISNQDKVLAVRGWLSSGKWSLPGGGLHRGEDPVDGAIREVFEETGITLAPADLHKVADYRVLRGMRFKCHAYEVALTNRPEVSAHGLEIVDTAWLDPAILCDARVTEPAAYQALSVWRKL